MTSDTKLHLDSFFDKTRKYFSFLIDDFSFEYLGHNDKFLVPKVQYANNTTKVEISYDIRESYIWVYVARNNKSVKYFTNDIVYVEWSYLASIVDYKTNNLQKPNKKEKIKTIIDIDSVLKLYAEQLRQHAQEILNGDFSLFSKMKDIADKLDK